MAIGWSAIESEERMKPTPEHLTIIYDFAHGAETPKSEVVFSLGVVCNWLYRQNRPKFHCQNITPFEATIAAAWCRVLLQSNLSVTALEFSSYLGQTYDAVIKKLSSGALAGSAAKIEIASALAECARLEKRP